MPIAPCFHIEHLHELALQIMRAPAAVRLRQIQMIEELIFEIEDETLYPLDYVVYRITGYRGDSSDQPMLLGSALVGDLVSTIAVVSHTLEIPAESTQTIEETANSLGVSTRTISRLRREGLAFRWVIESSGRKRLGCPTKSLQRFREKHEERIRLASGFSRLSPEEKREIVETALRYSGTGRSLSDIAVELSGVSGRGHETIRSILKQSPQTRNVLEKPPPISRTDARNIEKEIKEGVSWTILVERHQRTVGALRKVVSRLRATRLKQMDITYVELEVFARGDADEIILGAPVTHSVYPPILEYDLVVAGDPHKELNEAEETTVVSAMHLLRRRAHQLSKELKYTPNEDLLDRIETDLRWSFLLQQDLILCALPAAISVAIQHIGRPLDELPSSRTVALMKEVIRTVAEVCSTLDPTKGQTVLRTPASILDRMLSTSDISGMPERAAARRTPLSFSCPFHNAVPWSALIPQQDFPKMALEKSSELSELVAMKFGWMGRPRTVKEIASELDRTSIWVKRQLRSWS